MMESTIDKTRRLESVWLAFIVGLCHNMFGLGRMTWRVRVVSSDNRSVTLLLHEKPWSDGSQGNVIAQTTLSWFPGCSNLWIAHSTNIHPDYRSGKVVGLIRQFQNRVLEDMQAYSVTCTVRADNIVGTKAAKKAGYTITDTFESWRQQQGADSNKILLMTRKVRE